MAHCIPEAAGPRLCRLAERFELVWATGWEEKANEYLPFILALSERQLPCLTFDGRAVFGAAHWKLEGIEEYARVRLAAWLDDNRGEECRGLGRGRTASRLLVET